jgi:hypothetical protein
MSLPDNEPELGLAICYSYVWRHEAPGGREEGAKDRPCVIVTVVEHAANGEAIVTVMAIANRMMRQKQSKFHWLQNGAAGSMISAHGSW